MQFNFDCERVLGCDNNGIGILEGSCQNMISPSYSLFVEEIINTMGKASSHVQNLPTIVTNSYKFFSSDNRIFINAHGNTVLGYIRIGTKKLFLRDRFYNYHEVKPLCVLDFYVYETVQRQGIGKFLFDYMLNFERKDAREIAYDKPSYKLLNFLHKYFGLNDYIRQNNHFVVFDDFFNFIDDTISYDKDTNRALNSYQTPLSIDQDYYFKKIQKNNINNSNRNIVNTHLISDYRGRKMNNILNNSMPNLNQNYMDDIINKDVYLNPNTGFKNYYFNNTNTNAYDNIYSKKKINLINDYLSSKKQEPSDYIKNQISLKEKNITNSNTRLIELNNKINKNNINVENNRYRSQELFNKRKNFATIFDDKKIIENNYINNQVNNEYNYLNNSDFQNYQRNHIINGKKSPNALQHYIPFTRYGKVYTNILPLSSQVIGSFYFNKDFKEFDQYPNKLYY